MRPVTGLGNHVINRRRAWVGLSVAAAAVTVTGCSLLPTPPAPEAPRGEAAPAFLAGLPLNEDTTPASAAVADRLLQLDPCAVLDPAAAEQVFGQRGDEITPGDEITSCKLALVDPANYRNRTNVNVKLETYDASYKADTAPVQLPGGLQVHRTDMGTGCIYDHDLGSGYALSVQVSHYGAAEGQGCGSADQFLGAIAPALAEPPTRDQRLTTPSVPAVSPCIAIRQALAEIPPLPGNQNNQGDQRPQVSYSEPGQCAVQDWTMLNGGSMAHPQDRVLVAMEASDDPENYVRSGVLQPISVEGRPGTVRPNTDPNDSQPTCEVKVRMSDDVMIRVNERDDDGEVVTRVLRVQALTCEQAAQAAAMTLRAVGT